MTAQIDGSPFVAEFATVNRVGGQVYINGAGLPSSAIGFQFPDAGTGTYTIGPGLPVSAGVTVGAAAWVAGNDVGSGTIGVTTFTDSRIAGTFELTVVDGAGISTHSVTEGQFDIDY